MNTKAFLVIVFLTALLFAKQILADVTLIFPKKAKIDKISLCHSFVKGSCKPFRYKKKRNKVTINLHARNKISMSFSINNKKYSGELNAVDKSSYEILPRKKYCKKGYLFSGDLCYKKIDGKQLSSEIENVFSEIETDIEDIF